MSELSAQAYRIITKQEFDYFESESGACEFITAEGLNPIHLSQTELGYARVPRRYSHYLDLRLENAYKLLESGAQDFLHIDRYAVTLGRTTTDMGHSSGIDFVLPSHARSCSLRLRAADRVSFNLQPKQKDEPLQVHHDESVELPLGRNILLPTMPAGEYIGAVRDSFRDWERVLVVGDTAIKKYIYASWYENGKHITDKQRAARIGQVGLILAVEDALALGTDFRSELGDRNALERALSSIS